ncbi:hypothetical protein MtrunA17_Chr2g0285801 [Medicago truncatula]|uniref:Transmembrane protein, putative n=1 Tax=Medicago truncatula TaxID=3880 RepID=G7IP67_MEDTR|nr:uncharacterized protein LOC11446855 [Medicago truncatula]AES64152.1 transmembrane protein, putative [Medicago truncatula]RHN72264.1 hypothetical protein MtrunA17_Chr2g0285801 [Medicago truncatula]
MAKSPYLEEDCIKDYKLKNNSNPNKAKNLSFFASIFSLFIYICIFYIFNLSPYTLLNNNIFWFIMSNTLILIIAIDYEAFSSSKQKQEDLHEEYVKHSQEIRNHVSSIPTYDELQVDKQCIINSNQEFLQEEKETIVPERVLEIVVQNQPKKIRTSDDSANEKKKSTLLLQVDGDDVHKEHELEKATFPTRSIYRRSKSYRHNRAKHVVIDERRNSVRRLESMKMEPKIEEENEFSKMSNEDLNKRVEEFIQKFNKQIRLQASTIN